MWWRVLVGLEGHTSAAVVPPWPRRALLDAHGRVVYVRG
jgi:hypothetical protein